MKDDTANGPMPVARWDDLVVTEAGVETLVYDTSRHHIHHLNCTTAAVWRHCDGRSTIASVAKVTGVDAATIRIALSQLDDAELLAQPLATGLRMSRLSRRAALRRAGVAAAVAMPAIASVTAPAMAGLSNDGSCNDECEEHLDCTSVCRICRDKVCSPNLCGFPCDEYPDITCVQDKSGTCTACLGEIGSRTCQPPETAGRGVSVMGIDSSGGPEPTAELTQDGDGSAGPMTIPEVSGGTPVAEDRLSSG